MLLLFCALAGDHIVCVASVVYLVDVMNACDSEHMFLYSVYLCVVNACGFDGG